MSGGSGFVNIPGLSTTFAVPSQSVLYVETNGGVQTSSTSSPGYSAVDVALFIDGSFAGTPAFRVIIAAPQVTFPGIANWSFAVPSTLAPGTHTIDVRARLEAGSTASVSGAFGDTRQGILNVLVLKK